MENVIIKEITISNIDELLELAKEALIQCKDTQIFISNTFFERLFNKNKISRIWEEDVLDSFHYSDKVEKAFILKIKNNNEKRIYQMHFVANCIDYMHLTCFATKGVLYRHYLTGMKIILIINTD